MKVTTVREIIQKDGCKTTITIEGDMSDGDLNQLNRHLELVGFYESDGLSGKLKRIFNGSK